jgi:hypothetical protein
MRNFFSRWCLNKEKKLKAATVEVSANSDKGYQPFDITKINKLPWKVLQKFLQFQHSKIHIETGTIAKKLAVLVPYRHREEHLKLFIPHMQQFFVEQGLLADIFIIHQNDRKLFNKGMLLNIGFLLTKDHYDYFCFHDIDIFPLKSNYHYVNHPCRFIYKDYPPGNFGGVVLFSKEHFIQVNGFSNLYWNWGWEDTDLRDRCFMTGLTPITYMDSEYKILEHPQSFTQTPNGEYYQKIKDNKKILRYLNKRRQKNRKLYLRFAAGKRDFRMDGLNTVHYLLQARINCENYTRFDVILLAPI